jgi:hypothetical protein
MSFISFSEDHHGPPLSPFATATHAMNLTVGQMRQGLDRLQKRLDEVRMFEPTSVTDQYNIPHVEALGASVDEALVRTFGANTVDYNRYADAAIFDNGPHNYAHQVPIGQVHATLGRCKARSMALPGQAIASLNERITEAAAPMSAEAAPALDLSKIFVVHGHDGAPKAEVARFIERLGFEAIILHERPNKGRALITKFREEAAGVGFAVVLMTPDDLGKAEKAVDLNQRARQNVVFELGFFIGKLGPERLWSDLGTDRFQGLGALRQEIAVAVDDAIRLPEQSRGFFVGQVKVHDPKMGSLTTGREPLSEAHWRGAVCVASSWEYAPSRQEPMVRRLSAGGRWIRTFGSWS